MLLCHFHICLPLNRNSEKQIHGKEKLYIYRRQVTIHKCQGLSLDCVIWLCTCLTNTSTTKCKLQVNSYSCVDTLGKNIMFFYVHKIPILSSGPCICLCLWRKNTSLAHRCAIKAALQVCTNQELNEHHGCRAEVLCFTAVSSGHCHGQQLPHLVHQLHWTQ